MSLLRIAGDSMNALMALAVVALSAFLMHEAVEVLLVPMLVGASPLTMFG